MASGEASSVLSNSAERELPANVPPAITADKQALRDAPTDPAIDAATTPEELAAVQPAGLTVV